MQQGARLTHPAGFDLRPFLYPSRFEHQFAKIDGLAAQLPDRAAKGDKAKVD